MWPHFDKAGTAVIVRRYVLMLTGVIMFVMLGIISVIVWQSHEISSLQDLRSGYHQKNSQAASLIKHELHLLKISMLNDVDGSHAMAGHVMNGHVMAGYAKKADVTFYLIDKHIKRIELSQKTYALSRFTKTSQRVREQFDTLRRAFAAAETDSGDWFVSASILEKTITQLHALHVIADQEVAKKIKTGQQEHARALLLVIVLALVVGAFVTYRIMQALKFVMEKEARVARQIRESETKTRLLLNTAAEAIYGIDASGKCTFANRACVNMLGLSQESDLLGKNMHELMHYAHEDGRPYLQEQCPICIALGQKKGVHVDDEVFWRRDGSSFPCEYWAHPMVNDGVLEGAVVTFFDITERVKADQLKNEFISVVSHELRTPLTSIRGALSLLSSDVIKKQPDKAAELLRIGNDNTNRLLFLINDILDIQKMEAGKMEYNVDLVCMSALVKQAVDEAAGLSSQYHMTFEITEKSDVWVKVDANRLLQAITNLLSNAAKFAPEDTVVKVGVRRLKGLARVFVTDCGAGIPEDFYDRIFDKFSQSDSADTRKVAGTGLGLAIVKTIVEAHQGQVLFESFPGKATSFYIDLPACDEQVEVADSV